MEEYGSGCEAQPLLFILQGRANKPTEGMGNYPVSQIMPNPVPYMYFQHFFDYNARALGGHHL